EEAKGVPSPVADFQTVAFVARATVASARASAEQTFAPVSAGYLGTALTSGPAATIVGFRDAGDNHSPFVALYPIFPQRRDLLSVAPHHVRKQSAPRARLR